MKILILNGSPRPAGHTAQMIAAFREGAARHDVTEIRVCQKKIGGCMACEYCHTRGDGACIQADDMREVYAALRQAELLLLASPIYYHGLSGQLKCTIDRFYAIGTRERLPRLKKVAMFLSSGDPEMYAGALFSLQGDFVDYLGLENAGVFTAAGEEDVPAETLRLIRAFGAAL